MSKYILRMGAIFRFSTSEKLKKRYRLYGVFTLFITSALFLGVAPLFMPEGYSWISNTTSESAAQSLLNGWIARSGFLAFGFGVLWLSVSSTQFWSRSVRYFHMAFGIFMIATATFSHKPWLPNIKFDPIEDLLHSFTASAMGFAFSFGVVARLLERNRQKERGLLLDIFALTIATTIPFLISYFPQFDGAIQRFMFIVAYVWYMREAIKIFSSHPLRV